MRVNKTTPSLISKGVFELQKIFNQHTEKRMCGARAGLGFIAQYYHKILCYNQNVVYKDNK